MWWFSWYQTHCFIQFIECVFVQCCVKRFLLLLAESTVYSEIHISCIWMGRRHVCVCVCVCVHLLCWGESSLSQAVNHHFLPPEHIVPLFLPQAVYKVAQKWRWKSLIQTRWETTIASLWKQEERRQLSRFQVVSLFSLCFVSSAVWSLSPNLCKGLWENIVIYLHREEWLERTTCLLWSALTVSSHTSCVVRICVFPLLEL